MANKNTRRVKKQIAAACKRGETSVQIMVPRGDYAKSKEMTAKTFQTSTLRGDTVSSNRKRNMAERVHRNTGEDGKKFSVTLHEPLLAHEFVTFKGHDYLRKDKQGSPYRQFKQDQSRPAVV